MKILSYLTLIGNVVFALWILINGIDEGFKATPIQAISYLILITLLIINSILILKNHPGK
jgi:hypothetical protein